MKHKVVIIILSVLLTIFVLYGVMTTFAIRETKSEMSDLKIKYNYAVDKYSDVVDDYKELSENYQNEILDKVYSSPAVLVAIAQNIDNDATIDVINDSIVYMYVPYSSDIIEKVKKYVGLIPTALNTYGYKSCIIVVVDETGKCEFGWTILQNKDSYAFLSE